MESENREKIVSDALKSNMTDSQNQEKKFFSSPYRNFSLFKQIVLKTGRVSRTTKGGKKSSFTVLTAVKNKETGALGVAYSKGKDIPSTVKRSQRKAIKDSKIFFKKERKTIPYPILVKFNATRINLRPAPEGTGVRAGSVLNSLFKYAGIKNVTAKIIGSTNSINVTKCFFLCLYRFTGKRSFF